MSDEDPYDAQANMPYHFSCNQIDHYKSIPSLDNLKEKYENDAWRAVEEMLQRISKQEEEVSRLRKQLEITTNTHVLKQNKPFNQSEKPSEHENSINHKPVSRRESSFQFRYSCNPNIFHPPLSNMPQSLVSKNRSLRKQNLYKRTSYLKLFPPFGTYLRKQIEKEKNAYQEEFEEVKNIYQQEFKKFTDYLETQVTGCIHQANKYVMEMEKCNLKQRLESIEEILFRPNLTSKNQGSCFIQENFSLDDVKLNSNKVLSDSNSKWVCQGQSKKRVVFLYNDKKIYDEKTLKKIVNDLVGEYNIESLNLTDLENLKTRPLDKVFFFYFLSAGREQAQSINEVIGKISMIIPRIPLSIIILKDDKCDRNHIDLRKIQYSPDRIKMFRIFDESYAKFVLYSDTPVKKIGVQEIKFNYENLINSIRTFVDKP